MDANEAVRGTILIVDDEPDFRDTLAEVLTLEGYRPLCAADGMEALAYLRNGCQPCVILLDLMMPGMNGWEFRQSLLRRPEWSDLPIIVMSGVGAIERKAGRLVDVDYVHKPIDVHALLEKIADHCVRRTI